MTHLIRVNRTFESQTPQPTSLREGPIRIIPSEIIEFILFLTNCRERTRLVSRFWNDHTFTAAKNSDKYELIQIIQRITEKLNPDKHLQCIADLAELQGAHQSLSSYAATFAEVRRLFLINKGFVIGILRKFPEEERDQLQTAIGEELPDSMKDLFEISKLDLKTVKNGDLDTFFTLLQSCQPLSIRDRGWAVYRAIEINNIEFVKLLLANGSIFEWYRGWAVFRAAKINNIESVKLLLANGPISEELRGLAVDGAALNNNLELVKLLLANGSISEEYRGLAVCKGAENNNLELVKLVLASGPISDGYRGLAVWSAVKNDNPELVQLLRKPSIKEKIRAGVAACFACTCYSSKGT